MPVARPSLPTRRGPTAVALAGLIALGGCGNARQPAPDVSTPGPPVGSERVVYPRAGLTLGRTPAGWARSAGAAPAVATIATGQAAIGIFRYPRTEPLPKTKAQLEAATGTLLAAAQARDPTFVQIKHAPLKVDGHPAIQIRGTETIAGHPRTVRSTHVYAFGAEIVVDAYAPEADFRRVDEQAFHPLIAALRISKPTAGP